MKTRQGHQKTYPMFEMSKFGRILRRMSTKINRLPFLRPPLEDLLSQSERVGQVFNLSINILIFNVRIKGHFGEVELPPTVAVAELELKPEPPNRADVSARRVQA